MAKKKQKRSRKSGSTFNKELMGAAAYGIIGEPLLDQLAAKVGLGVSDEIIKGVAGWFVMQNTKGILRGMGKAAVIIAANRVAKQQLGNLNIFGGGQTTTTTTQQNSFV